MYIMQETAWCLRCKRGLAVTCYYRTTTPCTFSYNMNIWLYGFGWLSLTVKKCENHMAISLGCTQVLWGTSAAWSSVGPEVCGLHKNGHCWAAGWWHQWVYNEVFLDSGMQLLNHLTVGLHWLCHYLISSPRTGGPWCPSGLLIWYDNFKVCCDVSCTHWSTSQLCCSTQVSASVFTESNVPVHYLYCHSSTANWFQLCISHKNIYRHE